MSELSLRAYVREIDELIERERLEEAIAHCRYILQTYPKHLETYRLLGKAYLEAKRYGDAADIFQRVLSSVPDDFVSHVGMAIVREDEGNLDAAIWHMERAFETNPSNPAIQQEMKRLISRRDGLEPHKVRLTRGALARMYAHGELFAQAITELRSALQEDPERPDLQVLLASMYWHTDQRSDATAISNQILEKLPYCAEANRILAANLQASDRVEEAAVYHRRLANLDPYAAFVESALADANSVEETAVSLEKLDWVAGEPLPSAAPGQPGWAATLGMEMQEPSEELPEEVKPPQTGPLPSWLEPGEPPAFEAAAEKELRDEMETQAANASSEAGFLDELEAGTSDEPEQEGSGLGIAAAAAGIAAGVLAGGDEDESEEVIEGEPEVSPVGEATPAAGMFDLSEAIETSDGGLDMADDESTGEPEEGILAGEALPSGELVASDEYEGAAESDIPDWMQEAGWTEPSGEVEEAPVSFSDQELETLDAGGIAADLSEDEDAELTPAELPEWIHDIAPEEIEGSSDGAGDESLPAWIPSPEAGTGEDTEDEASFPAADSETSELPTWISDDSPGATETIVTWLEDRGPDSSEDEAAEGDDLPDWLRDTGPLEESLDPGIIEAVEDAAPSPEPQTEAPVGEPVEQTNAESPSSESWLSAVAAVAAEEEAGPTSPEGEAAKTPDWLSEAMDPSDEFASDEEPGLGLIAAGMIADDEGDEAQLAAAPDILDQDVGLESEGSISFPESYEEEIPSPSDTIDQPDVSGTPDWLEEIGTLPDQPTETDSADWLEGLEIDGEKTPAGPASETPDWLKGLAEEGADAEESSAPDWLREIGEPGSVSQEAEAVDAEPQEQFAEQPVPEAPGGAPDWLQAVTYEESAEESPEAVETEPEPETPKLEEDDEVMDWLEDLAAKQGEAPGDEELEATAHAVQAAPVLEERDIPDEPEEGLEWLEQLADQRGIDVDVGLPGRAAPEVSEPEPEPEPELDTAPGWLGRMATQPIPKVDMQALEAAARAEGVSPEAETIKADIPAQEIAPDDETIEGRAGDLQTEMEAASVGAEAASSEVEPEDEIPDWLISAAEQAEAPTQAPSGLPEEFAEDIGEPEPADRLAEPALAADRVSQAEIEEPSEPETVDEPVADIEQEAAISEATSEIEELEEAPPSEA
ncbi:MAG: tetratricopeptide repeat protein, partial [Anaerolineales bacterium]